MNISISNSTPGRSEAALLANLKQLALEKLDLSPEQLSAIERMDSDAALIETLQFDSLTQVLFMMEIEDCYGFTVEPEDIQNLKTIRDLVVLIQHRVTGT